MVNAIRVITQIARIQPIPGARIIIVEGTTDEVAMAKRLALKSTGTKADSAHSVTRSTLESKNRKLANQCVIGATDDDRRREQGLRSNYARPTEGVPEVPQECRKTINRYLSLVAWLRRIGRP